MCYWVKFKGLKNKTIVRERPNKVEATALVEYLERHGVKAEMGLYKADGQMARRKKTA